MIIREPNEQEIEVLKMKIYRKQIIDKLDTLELGETLFIEVKNKGFIMSLYNAMMHKGKKFNQIKQILGYTMTRLEL